MLTALSVARDCAMLGPGDRPVFVQVVPPTDTSSAHLLFHYAEHYSRRSLRPSQTEEGEDQVRQWSLSIKVVSRLSSCVLFVT